VRVIDFLRNLPDSFYSNEGDKRQRAGKVCVYNEKQEMIEQAMDNENTKSVPLESANLLTQSITFASLRSTPSSRQLSLATWTSWQPFCLNLWVITMV
jgi:hypothetical protein